MSNKVKLYLCSDLLDFCFSSLKSFLLFECQNLILNGHFDFFVSSKRMKWKLKNDQLTRQPINAGDSNDDRPRIGNCPIIVQLFYTICISNPADHPAVIPLRRDCARWFDMGCTRMVQLGSWIIMMIKSWYFLIKTEFKKIDSIVIIN